MSNRSNDMLRRARRIYTALTIDAAGAAEISALRQSRRAGALARRARRVERQEMRHAFAD